MGRKVESYWNCRFCRVKAIEGKFKECPNCGSPRGKDVKYYIIEKDKYVDDSVVEKGPDWLCNYCESYNPYSVNFCLRCGSSKEESTDDYFSIQNRKKSELETSNSYESIDHANEEANNSFGKANNNYSFEEADDNYSFKEADNNYSFGETDDDNNYRSKSRHTAFLNFMKEVPSAIADFIGEYHNLLIAIISILAIIGTLTFIFYPRKDTLNVTAVNWERSIEIQEYKTVRESDWSIPAGGRLVYSQEEFYKKEEVFDHNETVTEERSERYVSGQKPVVVGYEDLGNGYMEEIIEYQDVWDTRYYTVTYDKPVYKWVDVYKTKYYYDIERWVYQKTLSESGSSNPFWPETNLSSNERIGSKKESYKITAINKKNKQKTYTTSYELWNDVKVGNTIEVVIVAGVITKLQFKE